MLMVSYYMPPDISAQKGANTYDGMPLFSKRMAVETTNQNTCTDSPRGIEPTHGMSYEILMYQDLTDR